MRKLTTSRPRRVKLTWNSVAFRLAKQDPELLETLYGARNYRLATRGPFGRFRRVAEGL